MLHENASYFAEHLREARLPFLNSKTAIFPIICGDDWQAWRLARYCQRRGLFIQAIPYPVVPQGTARLRAAVSSLHLKSDLDYAIGVLRKGAAEVGGILVE